AQGPQRTLSARRCRGGGDGPRWPSGRGREGRRGRRKEVTWAARDARLSPADGRETRMRDERRRARRWGISKTPLPKRLFIEAYGWQMNGYVSAGMASVWAPLV